MPIRPSPTRPAIEQVGSIIGELFDISIPTDGNDFEEDEFRRRMQRKKKKRGRSM